MFVSVSAANADQALSMVSDRLVNGLSTTGVVETKSERHLLFNVQVKAPAGMTRAERDDAWVVLTSYGISPSKNLGSSWARLG